MLRCVFILLIMVMKSCHYDISEGDKICWIMDGIQDKGSPVSKSLKNAVVNLQETARHELASLGNGRIKEVEIEFENKIEATFHFVSDETLVELFCLSRK